MNNLMGLNTFENGNLSESSPLYCGYVLNFFFHARFFFVSHFLSYPNPIYQLQELQHQLIEVEKK